MSTTTRDSKRILSVKKRAIKGHQFKDIDPVNGMCDVCGSSVSFHPVRREQSKRILSATVKREADYDGDTSDLGEYSDEPNNYAIVNDNASSEHGGEFVRDLPCECGHSQDAHKELADGYSPCSDEPCACDDFNCVTIDRGREYRYYNPPIENYEGTPDDEMRQVLPAGLCTDA